MLKDILTSAGIPFRQGRFPDPPCVTYAVYFDDVDVDGADPTPMDATADLPYICHHDITVEIYEPKADDVAEAAIEAALGARGLSWTKADRLWLQNVQRYQVIYEFSYTDKP